MRDQFHIKQTADRVPTRGFSLIELMVTCVVVAILAAIAIPSYQQYMQKSRREDARTTLSTVVQAQERWRTNHSTYSQDVPTLLGRGADGSALSLNGHYTIAITVPAGADIASSYVVQATPAPNDAQNNDLQCQNIYVAISGGNLRYMDSSMTPTSITSPCWPQ